MATTRDFAPTKDGLKLRYEIRGEGDPLALIMGFSGSSRGWGEPFLKRHRETISVPCSSTIAAPAKVTSPMRRGR